VKDKLGTEIEVGDIVVSAASRDGGHLRVGKVVGFGPKSGVPTVISKTKKYDHKQHKYVDKWRRGPAGSGIIVLAKAIALDIPYGLADEIFRDYDLEVPE